MRGLPSVESDSPHKFIDIVNDATDHDWGVLIFCHFEQLRSGQPSHDRRLPPQALAFHRDNVSR
jgi:hypothetical protein